MIFGSDICVKRQSEVEGWETRRETRNLHADCRGLINESATRAWAEVPRYFTPLVGSLDRSIAEVQGSIRDSLVSFDWYLVPGTWYMNISRVVRGLD